MKKNILIIALLLIIAFVMRYLYLDCPLWYDEACSWAVATDKSGIMNNLINIELEGAN